MKIRQFTYLGNVLSLHYNCSGHQLMTLRLLRAATPSTNMEIVVASRNERESVSRPDVVPLVVGQPLTLPIQEAQLRMAVTTVGP